MIEAKPFGDGEGIFLYQEYDDESYETILYVYDGYLMEMLCETEWELDPEFGEIITEARDLAVDQPAPGLLRLTLTGTDGEVQSVDVFLRSEG